MGHKITFIQDRNQVGWRKINQDQKKKGPNS